MLGGVFVVMGVALRVLERLSAYAKALSALLAGACLTLVAGCAAIAPRNAVPDQALAHRAALPDLSGVRAWADEVPTDVIAEVRRRVPTLPALAQGAQRTDGRPVVNTLALSGGGSNGAFGAGVLAGWTARGDRPKFEIVTGVSAGALIAPFAFLGPRYDPQLREIWTRYRADQIITAQIVPGLLGGSALADTAPLADLIEQYVDSRFLAAIASEYHKGRLLLIGTTNLDAQRPVVWNMGGIAASRHPAAPGLFRKVLLASASIPGVFPPVSIPVVVDGKIYEEMHVDGGTTQDVFISPVNVPLKSFDPLYGAPPIRRIFLIQNGKLTPEYAAVEQQTILISVRAIYTLMKSQNEGQLYRIWRQAEDAGAEFNLVAIPRDFRSAPSVPFDGDYQSALFARGYSIGKRGGPWLHQLPSQTATASR
jgi:predicted acylesterase/phospholipase RssA